MNNSHASHASHARPDIHAGDLYFLLLQRLTESKQALFSAGEMLLDTDADHDTLRTVLDADAILKDLIERLDPAEPLTTVKQQRHAKA